MQRRLATVRCACCLQAWCASTTQSLLRRFSASTAMNVALSTYCISTKQTQSFLLVASIRWRTWPSTHSTTRHGRNTTPSATKVHATATRSFCCAATKACTCCKKRVSETGTTRGTKPRTTRPKRCLGLCKFGQQRVVKPSLSTKRNNTNCRNVVEM